MTQLIEAVGLALSSIWANKLRSFMMVLGNIVAVTSIIAVVSLIQGMNGYVSDALVSEVGIGTFRIDRVGVITDEEQEEEARRRNPVITLAEAQIVRKADPIIAAVLAEMVGRVNVSYRDETLEAVHACRAQIETYILHHPEFLHARTPLPEDPLAPFRPHRRRDECRRVRADEADRIHAPQGRGAGREKEGHGRRYEEMLGKVRTGLPGLRQCVPR